MGPCRTPREEPEVQELGTGFRLFVCLVERHSSIGFQEIEDERHVSLASGNVMKKKSLGYSSIILKLIEFE